MPLSQVKSVGMVQLAICGNEHLVETALKARPVQTNHNRYTYTSILNTYYIHGKHVHGLRKASVSKKPV